MEFIDWISEHPLAGDVIPESGGLRKVRWSRLGRGKLGGARVVYYVRLKGGVVFLLVAYAKASFDNLRPEFLRKLRERFDESE
ncbi:transcriptional regulator [Pseudoduganella sp. OTU4001]|uniref:transcriptional regulator n=1 Tax=Pseudoduganella sp. OTU4001 TaxID=3043854 RepID=UPI00313D6D06